MKTRLAMVLASVGGVALLLPGCAVGPTYKRPAINSPTNFRNNPVGPGGCQLARDPRKAGGHSRGAGARGPGLRTGRAALVATLHGRKGGLLRGPASATAAFPG